jgi:hypothetical protein
MSSYGAKLVAELLVPDGDGQLLPLKKLVLHGSSIGPNPSPNPSLSPYPNPNPNPNPDPNPSPNPSPNPNQATASGPTATPP